MTLNIVIALCGLVWAFCGILEMHLHAVWWNKAFPMATWRAHYVPDNADTVLGYLFGPIGLLVGCYERRNTRMY